MIYCVGRWHVLPNLALKLCTRSISSAEITTALRPFYFSVHPDLFEQHPNERTVNENSLKQLSSFLECIQRQRPAAPCTVQFYLRISNKSGEFKVVKIPLKERDLKAAIITILKTCDLSTENVDKLLPNQPTPSVQKAQTFYHNNDYSHMEFSDISDTIRIRRKVQQKKEEITLKRWISKHHSEALEKSLSNVPMQEEIKRLQETIVEKYGIAEVKWDCGWNETHFRGCLQSFLALASHHPEEVKRLKDRVLVFAPFTGVSLDGHIMLNSGEVRHNWLDLIKNVRKHETSLLRIPAFEKALSTVLKDIKIGRRKFMPKVIAGEYEKHLRQIMTSLSDFRGRRGYPNHWPDTLEDFEIVVETEAGPLMVSPTGQFIVPSSCPGFLLVNFITENMEEASRRSFSYNKNKHVERSLLKQCVETLRLASLFKDDSVTPDLMIECCQRLLDSRCDLSHLAGINLNITNYYSVLTDGVVCIPWNWNI